ncbi:METTL7A [Bugula neritina]|uniref:METTL7A n=1 Tax=Bugula neritina TaxID=10212 RepID=A0A7J7KBF1_BUGNE|nr:METTL7A [Bugula neritina]
MLPAKAIVEIGAGSGTNFQFYPNQCALRCVEPKVEFKGYVDDSLKKRGEHLASVEFVQGTGELLSQIESIKPGSVDYVVCTLVLCSVKDVSKVIQEVKTVLKPAGKFYFLEHVYASESSKLVRICQNVITPISKLLLDNCHHNREPWKALESAGFSSITYQRKSIAKASFISPLRWLCVGIATK